MRIRSKAGSARWSPISRPATRAAAEAQQHLADRDEAVRHRFADDRSRQERDRSDEGGEAASAQHEHDRLRAQLDESGEEARDLQQRVDSLLDELHARERDLSESQAAVAAASAARIAVEQTLSAKEDELKEFGVRFEATHRYAESKMLEIQQEAEAKVSAAQHEAEQACDRGTGRA